MGAIQQPTAAMGPYGVEIRCESFYLTSMEPTATTGAQRLGRHVLRIPIEHRPYVLAALDQVTQHTGWKDWEGSDGTSRTDGVLVTVETGQLLLHTPLPVYEQSWTDQHGGDSSVSVEIEYRDLAALQQALATAD